KNNPAINNDSPGIETLTQTVTATELNLDSGSIESLVPITRFVNLAKLDFSNNPIADLLPLSEVKTLVKLVGKNTQVEDLSVLKENSLLESIDLENSPIKSIKDVVSLSKLTYLNVNGAAVFKDEVPEVLFQRPDINVIYRSDELNAWWENLDPLWRDLFTDKFSLGENPDTEALHQLTSKSELSFERVNIPDLTALTAFVNLRSLEVFDAPISSVAPLSGMHLLTKLRLSQVG